jgi:uncharacterized membrane protein YphA (DoxX/SURF4 family)
MRRRFDLLRKPAVIRGAQILIGVVFLFAALAKIADLEAFALQLHNYRMTPIWSENLLAMTLPWVELLAGLALVFGVRPRSGAVVVLALLILFTATVGIAWARGLDVSCGCFGKVGAAKIGAQKLLENIGLVFLAAMASIKSDA